MPRYTFVVEAGISLSTSVEADSLEEAVERAQRRGVQGLCWQCSRGTETEWCTSGELDCDPVTSKLVDVCVDDVDVPIEEVLPLWEGS